jgi:hypothetical protein
MDKWLKDVRKKNTKLYLSKKEVPSEEFIFFDFHKCFFSNNILFSRESGGRLLQWVLCLRLRRLFW